MPLTALAVSRLVPAEKPFKRADGAGLYLLVQPNGSMLWRLDYRFDGRRKTLALGSYPTTSLAAARAARETARAHLEARRDPSALRRSEQNARRASALNTFVSVGERWLQKRETEGLPIRTVAALRRHIKEANRRIGSTPVAEVEPADILFMVRRVEARGVSAGRFRSTISRVFRFAIAEGLAKFDPAAPLVDAVVIKPSGHYPSPKDPVEVGRVLNRIDAYPGAHLTRRAIMLLAYTFVRPQEIRAAEWSEIDLPNCTWIIPAGRMKKSRDHVVPLSRQAVALFQGVRKITGDKKHVFPSTVTAGEPMGAMTMNAALIRMEFATDYLVPHGFRSIASTTLNESGLFSSDWIERQLAHVEGNSTRAAYNAALYLPQRTEMMQWYANWIDRQRDLAELLG